ncbi:MAG TPA: branched-chain amino acid ABC transporter permease, partial [Bacillota bacterium]|nr:branched-chain amino acid ABC transporter permease [Bacillota bacterium]
ITILFTVNLMRSTHGRALLSIREDEIAAEAMGINTTFYKVFAFSAGAFFAGIAGGLFAHSMGYIAPANFEFMRSIEILVMVVLGGLGSITGSVIATVVLTILPEALRGFAQYRMVLYSAMLIAIMLFRPSGLMGTRELDVRQVLGIFKTGGEKDAS